MSVREGLESNGAEVPEGDGIKLSMSVGGSISSWSEKNGSRSSTSGNTTWEGGVMGEGSAASASESDSDG